MLSQWFAVDAQQTLTVVVFFAVTYFAIIVYTRVAGLRSFSKMSAFDVAMTLAIGSVFASATVSTKQPVTIGLLALACLFAAQWGIAFLRSRVEWISKAVDNEPILLMAGEHILDDNLAKASVSRNDLYGKLREANVLHLKQVRAVVFETTGDISVLHSEDDSVPLALELFDNVIGCDALREHLDNLVDESPTNNE